MTRQLFTDRLPLLCNNPLPFKPPFIFNGLSSRVFPLRANLDSLQRFVNRYLNFVPESVGRFRASVPYVFLSVLDYGQVAESRGLGWFAQMEVFFAVPLEWYRWVDGQWVFHDWATITPFIYVNDNYSVPLGRTVMGFPKVLSQVTAVHSDWVRDPVAPVTLASVETEVFPAAYEGRRLENRVFLEVMREAPMSNLRVPFDPRSPIAPWTVASHLANAMGGFGRDALWLAQALRIFPQLTLPGAPAVLREMAQRMAPAMAPGGRGAVTNSLNLKQFRRADRHDRLAYQALTNGPMVTSAFNKGGLLGEERTLLGDLAGGHTIRLHEYATLPIARTLGLEAHRRWRGDGVDVAEFRPVMPFWMDVNVSLEPSTNLAWRSSDGVWKDGSGHVMPPDQSPGAEHAPRGAAAEMPHFNSVLASTAEAITGPFEYAGTAMRVLPLLAERERLQAFIDDSINSAITDPALRSDDGTEQVRLEVWSRPAAQVDAGIPIGGTHAYVYMVATSFAGVLSGSNNVGDWAKFELAFLVPVKWQRKKAGGDWETLGVGVVPAFVFVDDCIATISRFEVQGIDARTANFIRPESTWLSDGADEDKPRQTLLRVEAEVWAALQAGQQAKVEPIVEIVQREVNAGLGGLATQDNAFVWAEKLRIELGTKKGTKHKYPDDCKVARALALELMGNQAPLAMYTLKQFRDAVDPDKACYQSLVRISRQFTELVDMCEIEETLAVRIRDYPKLKIVEQLGLFAARLPDSGAGVQYSAQAIRPFYVRGTLFEPLAEELMTRSGSRLWKMSDTAFSGRLGAVPDGPALVVNLEAESLQDRMDPCRITAVMFNARDRAQHQPGNLTEQERKVRAPLTARAARRALDRVDAQMVIESVLSREWGNADATARWREGRRELCAALESLPVGVNRCHAEKALYESAIRRFDVRQGYPERLSTFVKAAIASQYAFTERRQFMEAQYDILVAALLGIGQPDLTKQGLNDGTDGPAFKLLASLLDIESMQVVGEPSSTQNLDMKVRSCQIKLHELLSLDVHLADLVIDADKGDQARVDLDRMRVEAETLRQAVGLARQLNDAQREATLNAVSRAWQKPDFCIRRDAAGPESDRLLTLVLSWDAEWYHGMRIADVTPEPAAKEP